ncbi:MAG TPA: O-antigen ligase family protein [Cyclobacteriaceae bacterium]|nr:O-antigen ligase family protein [Cyclobacteriaceae bacterium]
MIRKDFFTFQIGYSYDLFFVLTFICGLPFSIKVSNIVLGIYVPYILYRIFQNKKAYVFNLQNFKRVASLPMLFLMFALSLFYSADRETGLSNIVDLLPLLIVPVLFCFIELRTQDKKLIFWSFTVVNFLIVYINFIRAIARSLHVISNKLVFDASVLGGYGFFESIVQGGNFFFYHEFSSALHPTYWSFFLVFCLAFLSEEMGDCNLKKKYLIFGTFLIGILACSSRIVLISVPLLIAAYFVMTGKNNYTIIAVAAITILCVLFALINPRFDSFFSLPNTLRLDAIRFQTWQSAIEVFKKNPFFGAGIGDARTLLNDQYLQKGFLESYTYTYNEHNQYFQIANSIGLIGLSIFLMSIGNGFVVALRGKNFLQFTFIFLTTLVCMVENFLDRRAGIIFFSVFYCLLFLHSVDQELKSKSRHHEDIN